MLKIAFIGVGNRAGKYLSCLPADAKVAFLVDPDPVRLSQAAANYGVPASACFQDAETFFSAHRDVDGVIITTPDRLHHGQAMDAIRAGYPVLLEKPAAASQEEFDDLLEESERTGVPVSVCLIMRYHPYFRRIKEIVESGEIGRIVSIDHTESIGPDRMGHTFVRGLWSRKDLSGPIFLSKCSHDVDFLLWLAGGRALDVSSEGALTKFNIDHAPAGAALRCLDCTLDCPYSAVKLYRDRKAWVAGFDVPERKTLEAVIEEELKLGRYGRCVYHCDNDVNDLGIERHPPGAGGHPGGQWQDGGFLGPGGQPAPRRCRQAPGRGLHRLAPHRTPYGRPPLHHTGSPSNLLPGAVVISFSPLTFGRKCVT